MRRYSRFRDLHLAMKARYGDKVGVTRWRLDFVWHELCVLGGFDTISVPPAVRQHGIGGAVSQETAGALHAEVDRDLQDAPGVSFGLRRPNNESGFT